jgi:heme-degrading monooxygenase HmoA
MLEAHVAADKSAALLSAFGEATGELDEGIEETFLAQNAADPSQWKIITVWRNREVLEAMRQSGETPRGVLMFRSADAEPTLSVYEVAGHAVDED